MGAFVIAYNLSEWLKWALGCYLWAAAAHDPASVKKGAVRTSSLSSVLDGRLPSFRVVVDGIAVRDVRYVSHIHSARGFARRVR